eukprot:755106-Hanusia_phi.AAC.2
MRVVVANGEEVGEIEDRMQAAAEEVLSSLPSRSSLDKKMIRGKIAQISQCFMQKVKRNTRLQDEEWSDTEEREKKMPKKEVLEPEDLVLKARVEMLRNKIKESAERVKKYRVSIPSKISEATKDQIQKSSKLLDEAMEDEDQSTKENQPEEDNSVFSKNKEIFLAETSNFAQQLEALGKKIPEQIRQGRSTVRVCQEWARKPISEAEAVLVEELKVLPPRALTCCDRCTGHAGERGSEN